MSIATRKGDDGTTGLLYGQRVAKDHPQVEALGAFDELNVEIGGARLAACGAAAELLAAVQGCLVAVMGEIACAEADAATYLDSKMRKLTEADLGRLDAFLGALEARGVKLDGWATPGSNAESLAFDRARVAARRAERRLASLASGIRKPRPLVLQWTNRLSDLLWLLAREADSRRT